MSSNFRIASIWVAGLMLAQWLPVAGAQTVGGDSLGFTAAQSVAGRQIYRESCAVCHGAKLEGQDLAPSLAGDRFDQMWRGKSADVLQFHVRRMPPEAVESAVELSDENYAEILAYLLQSNGFEPGEAALPSDMAALGAVSIPRKEGTSYDPDAPVAGAAERSEALKNLPAVTEEMERNPSPDDWLRWGRTYDGQNYSPLTAINRETVANLAAAWHAPLQAGVNMPTPLVHHGVMFLHSFPDAVLALDASNGEVLWRYRYAPKTGSSQKMGLALSGDKVLVPTSDLHILALNARTGELIWDHTIATETDASKRGAYQIRSAPMAVGDIVIQGVTASFVPRGGFLVAVNIETGKEAWRFNTIARPGEPGGDSWNDVPLDQRSGGSVWHQGTYDPELNLIYYGVAPTYDTGPLVHPLEKEGISSEALYTNCTIALNADTGKLVWHYQHMANDQWDLDWVFERQVVTMPINGEPRKVVVNTGKMGIVEGLDAATGAYLFSVDAGVQNVITAIDTETGQKKIDPDKWPDPNRPCVVCPSALGARSWPPTSYSPATGFLYLPLTEWCMGLGAEGFRLLTSGVGLTSEPHPNAADGMIGRIMAIDLEHHRPAWVVDLPAPQSTSLLATAGGVVFSGDLDPALKAFDDSTGELLWQAPLDDLPSSTLVTYGIAGRQYVAVVVGQSNFHVRDISRTYNEFRASEGLKVEEPPKGGAAIWVFAL